MPSTEDLVKAAQAGETPAFAELVRRYERTAIITALGVLGNFHSSQDAAQEAFIVVYEKLHKLRDGASFGPWLLQIVRRRALRLKRSRNREQTVTIDVEPTATQRRDWMQQYDELVQHFARLPEHERIVAVMRHVDGCSVKKIAESTGKPVGTITKQLSRATQRLRNWLVEE